MDMNSRIIQIIEDEMKAQGITVAELVRRTGYTRRAIDYWLHGERNISLKAADCVLSILGRSYLIGMNDELGE